MPQQCSQICICMALARLKDTAIDKWPLRTKNDCPRPCFYHITRPWPGKGLTVVLFVLVHPEVDLRVSHCSLALVSTIWPSVLSECNYFQIQSSKFEVLSPRFEVLSPSLSASPNLSSPKPKPCLTPKSSNLQWFQTFKSTFHIQP